MSEKYNRETIITDVLIVSAITVAALLGAYLVSR